MSANEVCRREYMKGDKNKASGIPFTDRDAYSKTFSMPWKRFTEKKRKGICGNTSNFGRSISNSKKTE